MPASNYTSSNASFLSFKKNGNIISLISKICITLLIISAAGALDAIKEGGARAQGIIVYDYNGPLKYINHLLIILSLIGTLILAKKSIKKETLLSPPSILLAFILIALPFSLANAIDLKESTIRVTTLIIASIISLLIYVKSHSARNGLHYIHNVFIAINLSSVIMIFLIPSYGISYGDSGYWQGVFNHKNQLGAFSSISACISIALFKFHPKISIANLALAIFLAIGSQSYSSIGTIALVISLFFISSHLKFISNLVYTFRVQVLLVSLTLSFTIIYLSISGVTYNVFGKDTSFTERNLIWQYSLAKSMDSLFFGHGISSFLASNQKNSSELFNAVGQELLSAHNGFITSFYELGLIGFTFFICWLFFIIKSLPSKEASTLPIIFYFISFVIFNTFESKGIGFNLNFVVLMYFSLFFTSKTATNDR